MDLVKKFPLLDEKKQTKIEYETDFEIASSFSNPDVAKAFENMTYLFDKKK